MALGRVSHASLFPLNKCLRDETGLFGPQTRLVCSDVRPCRCGLGTWCCHLSRWGLRWHLSVSSPRDLNLFMWFLQARLLTFLRPSQLWVLLLLRSCEIQIRFSGSVHSFQRYSNPSSFVAPRERSRSACRFRFSLRLVTFFWNHGLDGHWS